MNSQISESALLAEIIAVEDYRTFLKKVLQLTSRNGEKCNMAAFSRKAGFSSRSFLTQVLDGRRRLTSKSFPKIENALPVSPKVKSYFQLLVAREEPEINFEALSPKDVENRIKALRGKFQLEADGGKNRNNAVEAVFKGKEMMECYAALGPNGVGATLEEICARTRLPRETCLPVLKRFMENQVVLKQGDRYLAKNPYLAFTDLGADGGFKECYIDTLGELKRKAQAAFKADDRVFYQHVFSIDRQNIPKLKKRLWEVINEFVEEHEADGGDSIAKFIAGFYI